MNNFLVISDDFSGAYDVGTQIKKNGLEVKVVNGIEQIPQSGSCIVNTDTRNMNSEEAYAKISFFLNKIDVSKYDFFYKKVDSTLRGNICAEIRAIDEAIGFDLIVVAPAYPKLSRHIVNGIAYYNESTILKTDLSRDPGNRVIEDNIKVILEKGFNEKLDHIDIEQVRCGQWYNNVLLRKIVSFDTILDSDLDIIVHKLFKSEKKILWVGSIGLMEAILRKVCLVMPVLGIVGSVCDLAREQIEYAKLCGVNLVGVDMREMLNGKGMEEYVAKSVQKLQEGKDVIICSALKQRDIILVNEEQDKVLQFINEVFAKVASRVLDKVDVSGIFITGGDTASCFIGKETSLYPEIVGEILPSIPLVKFKINKHMEYRVILKSGHVGDKETIVYCINKLKEKF